MSSQRGAREFPDLFIGIRDVTKTFFGVPALSHVDLDILHGEVHGLLGENGSGKSTLIKVLAGYHVPASGDIVWAGRRWRLPVGPATRRMLGFAFVHQDLGLIPSLTVAENLALERITAPPNGYYWPLRQIIREAQDALERYGVHVNARLEVSRLRAIDRALVAIVRALEVINSSRHPTQPAGTGARAPAASRERGPQEPPRQGGLLVLDEPTAYLARDEVLRLFEVVRQWAQTGCSVLFVSHDLAEVQEITDRVTVLRDGEVVGSVDTAGTSQDVLIEMIVGRSVERFRRSADADDHKTVMCEVRNLTTPLLDGISFAVQEGEVLGVTGLLGSGYEDIPYALYGAKPAAGGDLVLGDRTYDLRSLAPGRALSEGIILIPSDRLSEGGVGSLSVAENIAIPFLDRYFHRGHLRRRQIRSDARVRMREFDVRPPNPQADLATFSGGNQQKVILAKWYATTPRLVLLSQPTQGVDVGARQQIYEHIRRLGRTAATVCASGDHEELATLCDRVLVVADGRVVADLRGATLSKATITQVCLEGHATWA